MITLGARDRRALRLGAIIIGAAALWAGIIRPSIERRAQLADLLEAERALLSRELAMVQRPITAGRAPGRDSLARARGARFFAGDDDVIVTAQLVDYLGETARPREIWLQSAATRPARTETAGVRQLEVELRAEGDIAGVLRFLDAIEHGERTIRITDLDLRGEAMPADDGTNPLVLAATVRGFAPPRAKASSPASTASTATAVGPVGGRP